MTFLEPSFSYKVYLADSVFFKMSIMKSVRLPVKWLSLVGTQLFTELN